MCDICLQTPCPSGCPGAKPPEPVFVCSGCGKTIYEGEDYCEFLNEQFCEECVFNAWKTAEYFPEEPEFDKDEEWLKRATN